MPRRLIILSPAVLMLMIASVQISQVWSVNQTRWRGGGFGMYSDYHASRREIWGEYDSPSTVTPTNERLVELAPRLRPYIRSCRLRPSRANLAQLAKKLAQHGLVPSRISVWQLVADTKNRMLGRKKIATWNRAADGV